jgi:monovalent cation:H+ antiporter, CPA1 family
LGESRGATPTAIVRHHQVVAGGAGNLISVATLTLVIAGFLVLVSVVQPAAERLHLPYTVLLAIVGVAVGGLSSFLLYTPLTTLFDDLVAPVVNLPLSSSIFLVVFMPILLFHAALTIDLREIAEDTAPILTLTESGSEAATSSARWPY